MGICTLKGDGKDSEVKDRQTGISKGHFDVVHVIGKGGFGKVWKVEHKVSGVWYAMKEMSKVKVIAKKSTASVMNERKLLGILNHPFLVNMHYAFQDRESLYLAVDLMRGGDLRYHFHKQKQFSEAQTSEKYTEFFAACIVQGLEYLHECGILHRDIKPENLVLDSKGYVRITDFGIARVWQPDNARDTSGTPGYMAPEVLCRQNHGVAVDYFALGVLCYEFMIGARPYLGKTRKEVRDLLLAKQVQLHKADLPEDWTVEALDFINRLIQRKPISRLGLNGPQEVKAHPWFDGFPWDKLASKTLEAPYLPSATENNFDLRVQQDRDPWKEANQELVQQSEIQLKKDCTQELFAGYHYEPSLFSIEEQIVKVS